MADYLFAEVLQRQTEPVRQLLLRTSILERVNGSLADRLLGATGSERILLQLEDAGAFVFSIDRERSWFRYHQLFADLLRLELRRTEPDAVPGLHRAAAEWYAGHGFPIDAIRHAQAAKDWGYAGDLIGEYGFSLALDGSYATMTALLEAFPAEAFANPELAAFLAYGEVIRPSLDTAAAYLAVAERHASEVPDERRQTFAAMLAATRSTLARWRGDYGTIVSEVAALLEPSEAESVIEIAVGNDVRAVALMNLGAVELWSGAGDDAERHLKQGLELARRNGRPYVEMGCLGHLALAVGRHSLTAMRETALQTLEIMEKQGWLSEPIAPMVLATMGGVDALQGRFDEAEPWLDRAEQALRPNAEPAKEMLVRHSRGLQRLGQGRLAEAKASFAETQRLQSLLVSPDPLAIWARGCLAQVLMRTGRPSGSSGRARRPRQTASSSMPTREPRSRRSISPSGILARRSMTSRRVTAHGDGARSFATSRSSMRSSSTPSHGTCSATRGPPRTTSSAHSTSPSPTRSSSRSSSRRRAISSSGTPGTARRMRRCSRTSSTCSRGRRCPLDAASSRTCRKRSPRARSACCAISRATCRRPRSRPRSSSPRAP